MLSRRQLNRASLHRQSLLARAELSVCAALERLAGMQAQAPNAPYVGLWSRLSGFQPAELADELVRRRVVRTPLLRGTVHLVVPNDARDWYPLVRPVLARGFASNYARALDGVDLSALLTEAATLLADRPMTRVEIGAALAERWPARDRTSMAYAVTCLLPVVQVPPRGVWGQTSQATWTTAETWLGDTAPTGSVADMVVRYLTAFGPATVRDIQTWCGLTRLREVTDQLPLRQYQGEDGATLLDVPDAELPDPETPAPPRFLPEYDNLLLSYADRARVGADHRAVPLPPGIGGVLGSVLVDGFWRAGWRLARTDGTATLHVEPFDRLTRADTADVTEEGHRLLEFIAADADRYAVVFATAVHRTPAR
ncbi:MAG TPA: winged helix DNA-binding domain-containing protein [Pseudonocardiaceae bacterium]|nr:winged helix DNA-binding domain-containing protein [Pseudonocardiaceae bacterium]